MPARRIALYSLRPSSALPPGLLMSMTNSVACPKQPGTCLLTPTPSGAGTGWDQSSSGKPVVTLTTNFPFRAEQQSVTSLSGFAKYVNPDAYDQTTNTICGAIIDQ
jgi:hypothetical protein